MGLLESADRSRVGVVVVNKTLRNAWLEAPINLLLENDRSRRKPNPLRNEAQLNQMNVPYGTPWTAPHVTTGGLCRWKAIN
jgi:hypothetical protein